MTSPGSLADFCRYVLAYEEGRCADNPVHLGAAFREYVGIQRTPSLAETISLVRSLGIKIEAAHYLNTGGTNMMARGYWHIHYGAKDRPATQKFTIFHELFEIIHKSLHSSNPSQASLEEPLMSRYADHFAASALIPPRFFVDKACATGCDLVRLGEDLGLSHQCLLIALGRHFTEIPFVGILYEHRPDEATAADTDIKDLVATVVVRTPRARRARDLCALQSVPARNGHPQTGSLVCAALTGGRPVLWRSPDVESSPAILVRPLLSAGLVPYRVILLALPNDEFGMISSQVETIEPALVGAGVSCPAERKCRNASNCIWKSTGGHYEH